MCLYWSGAYLVLSDSRFGKVAHLEQCLKRYRIMSGVAYVLGIVSFSLGFRPIFGFIPEVCLFCVDL